jgi:hypothetical protein
VNSIKLVIGFNSLVFDDQVCQANDLDVRTGYDILKENYMVLGLDPNPVKYGPEYKSYGLNAMAMANGLDVKSDHGAFAPDGNKMISRRVL